MFTKLAVINVLRVNDTNLLHVELIAVEPNDRPSILPIWAGGILRIERTQTAVLPGTHDIVVSAVIMSSQAVGVSVNDVTPELVHMPLSGSSAGPTNEFPMDKE